MIDHNAQHRQDGMDKSVVELVAEAVALHRQLSGSEPTEILLGKKQHEKVLQALFQSQLNTLDLSSALTRLDLLLTSPHFMGMKLVVLSDDANEYTVEVR